MKKPKVSIIIPVYNGSNYVKYAIDCALNQTYENLEIIVVNDGSSDGGKTEELVLSYGSRIRYFSKPNGGVSSALNYGIQKMTGEYFSWLSHDDVYTNEKIENAIKLLEAHKMLDKKCIAFTGGYYIDAVGEKMKNFRTYFTANIVYSGYEVVNIMTQKGTLNGCCMLIPKKAFDEVGGFDEALRYSQDSLMWYRLFLAGYSLVSDNLPNVMNRVHKNQVTNLRRDLYEHDSLAIAKLLAEPLAKFDNTGRVLIRYIKRLTRHHSENAFQFMYNYANENGYLSRKDSIRLKIYRTLGFFRYKIVTGLRKLLLHIRR